MPLLKCPVCGGEVSDAAAACPHCGHPRSAQAPGTMQGPPAPSRSGTPGAFFVMLIGTVLVMVSLAAAVGWYAYHRFQQAVHRNAGPELVDYQDTVAPDTLRGNVPLPEALPADSAYELSMVEDQPRLANIAEVQAALAHNYPPLLRDAGVTGTVTLRMRVDADGNVDPRSVTVEQTTHDAFADAATRVAETMRFIPAKIHQEPVPVWITIPITFQLAS